MKKIIPFLLFLLCHAMALRGQDTLERFLSRKDIPVQAKVDRLNGLARDIAYVNPLRSTDLSYRALQLSQEADYPRGVAYSLRGIASSLLTEERIYLCLKNLQRSLQIFTTLNDSTGVAGCYISLGHLYRRLQDRDRELFYHKKAFTYFSRQGSPERVGVTTHNLGETYFNRGDYKMAIELTERAIAINDSLRNYTVLSACYRVMGNIKLAQLDKTAAAFWYAKTIEVSDRLGAGSQKVATVDALLNLANLATEKNHHQEALIHLQRALLIVKENRLFTYVQPLYEAIMQNQIRQGALQELRSTIDDYSKTSSALNKVKTEVMFRFTENMLRIDSLEKTATELQETTISQNKLIEEKNSRTRMTLIFMVSLLALSVVLAYNVVMLRKANHLLTEQRAMVRRQNEQLEELNALKNKFLSILSHDIKAPLQGLKSYVGLLKAGGEHINRGQLIEFGAELEKQLENTTKMADNLIVWAKLQMKKASTRPQLLSVSNEVGQAVSLYEKMASEKNLTLHNGTAPGDTVWADPDQINFILRNLVHNAIKYSSAGEKVTINAHNEGSRCLIEIIDTGEGISKEALDTLYGYNPMITKVGTAGEEGTGLGLRICLEFAQLNRGEIKIKNNPAGRGTCFTISLPSQQA